MARILISSRDVALTVDLNDTSTAAQMLAATPFESSVSTWGQDVHFETPLTAKVEKGSRAEVQVGDVAYWPPERRCVSSSGRLRPARDPSRGRRAQ